MVLIRIITQVSMELNCRVYAKYVKSEDNGPAGALSRLQFAQFAKLMTGNNVPIDREATRVSDQILPMEKVWFKY